VILKITNVGRKTEKSLELLKMALIAVGKEEKCGMLLKTNQILLGKAGKSEIFKNDTNGSSKTVKSVILNMTQMALEKAEKRRYY
jgi:hypothetical protein